MGTELGVSFDKDIRYNLSEVDIGHLIRENIENVIEIIEPCPSQEETEKEKENKGLDVSISG